VRAEREVRYRGARAVVELVDAEAAAAREKLNQIEYGTTTGQFAEEVISQNLPENFDDARPAQKTGGQGIDLLADQHLGAGKTALAAIEVKGTTGEKRALSKAQERDQPRRRSPS
jgi:hypothetical protein